MHMYSNVCYTVCYMYVLDTQFIATVQQTQPTIQLLLSTSDFVGAIDLITTTQDVLQQELRGVHSLRCVCVCVSVCVCV